MVRCRPTGIWLVLLLAISPSCDREATTVKGQRNAPLTFFGLTVDQDGTPLPGVRVEYECEAFPADWTFEKRGEPLSKSVVSATSDERGRFHFDLAKVHTLRRLNVVVRAGYRHLYEQHVGGTGTGMIPSTYGYLVTSWSDLCYKTDPEHPAIFVFVKDGLREVSALPCRGGYDSGNGKHWTLNKPAWPKKPSLKDVVRKQQATEPSTAGA